MTGDQFRELALDLQGVEERAHMKHPDFRVNGRIFATLQADEQRGMVKVSPDEQRELLAGRSDVFTPASGAWGRQGCTMVTLAAADTRTVRAALTLAWELAIAQGPTRATPRARPRTAARRPRR